MKLRARWLIPFAALPVVGLLAYGFRTDPRAVPSPLVGRPAPAFALTTFDGKAVSLESQRGKVVVLNFWASWCYPACYEEAPVLEASWRRVGPQGVVVLGVAIQDKDPASLEFIQRFGLTFPNAPDPAGKVSIDYGVYGVPETFVIDRRGVIRRKHVGAVTEAVFREWVEPLLRESADPRNRRSAAPATGRLAGLGAAALLLLAVGIAAEPAATAAPVSEEEVHAIASQLRCVVCQNLSVADSPSEMARQMRDLIRERLAAGDRPEQVKAYFVQRYGDWVLLAPPARGLNLLLWLAPFGAVAAGLVVVATLARRWRRRAPSPEPAATPAVGPAERERLAAELERLGD